MSGISLCEYPSCTPGFTFRVIVGVGALGAIAVGVISLLAHYQVLGGSWDLLKSKVWSHICWGGGASTLLVLGIYTYLDYKKQGERQSLTPPLVISAPIILPPPVFELPPPTEIAAVQQSPYLRFRNDMQGSVLGRLAIQVIPPQVRDYKKFSDGSFELHYRRALKGKVTLEGKEITLLFADIMRGKLTEDKKGALKTYTLTLTPVTARVPALLFTTVSATLVKVEHVIGNANEPRDITIFGEKLLTVKKKMQSGELQKLLQAQQITFN